MANFKNFLISLIKNVVFFIAGVFVWSFLLIYLIVSSPIFIYRWILTKIIVPVFKPNVGKVVNVMSQVMAAEFLNPKNPSRSTIVVTTVVEGHVSLEELSEAIETRWIKAKTEQGTLKYPELQQYLIYWLGFMFWKQETKFDLQNHIYCHKINDVTDQGSERSLCQLIENLQNKPYAENKSPWDMHLVHNYMNSSLGQEKRNGQELKCSEMSVIILRIHHSMGDGFAIMHLLMEQLCNVPLNASQVATPTKVTSNSSFVSEVISFLMYPINFFRESGNLVVTISWRRKTPFHISDSNKSWTLLYGRSNLIPISKIKFIKNTFGVSFAAVIKSSLSAGIAKIFVKLAKDNKERKRLPKELLFAIPLPPTNQPNKLRINASGGAFTIPVKPELNAVDRLRECEWELQRIKSSPMALIVLLAFKSVSSNLAPVSRFIIRNRFLGTGASSFPGPQVEVSLNQKRLLAADFVTGLLEGDAGLGFMILSLAGHVRISATAENAVLSRDQLDELIDLVCKEIDLLYHLALNMNNSIS